MINPLAALTLPQRIGAAMVAVALLALAFYAYGGMRWAAGYASGVKSTAGEIAKLTTTVEIMKGASDALKKQHAADLAAWEQTYAQGARDYAVVLDWQRAHPLRVRVVAGGGAGDVRTAAAPAGSAAPDPARPGMGETGTAAAVITEEEVNRRLNACEQAVGQLAAIIQLDEENARKGLVK